MKRTIISLLLLAIPSLTYAQAELLQPDRSLEVSPFHIDAASFMDEEGKTYLEVYYQLSNSSLKFVRLHNQYIASFEVTLSLFTEDGRLAAGKSFQQDLLARSYVETNLRSQIFIKTLKIPLNPGKYTLVVGIKDLNSNRARELKRKVLVPNYSQVQGISFSDVVFGRSINRVGDVMVVTPNPPRTYSDLLPNLVIYYEIYNNNGTLPKDSLVQCQIIDDQGQVRYEDEKPLIKGKRIFQDYFHFTLDNLPGGKYSLKLKVADKQVTERFFIQKSIAWIPDDYEKTIRLLKYIATDQEMEKLKNVKKEERKKAWLAFWRSKDPTPGTIENEVMLEYYRRIRYANENFTVCREGWLTDRGRIYIKYGPPDEIERHAFQFILDKRMSQRQRGKAYQYWYYYRIHKKFHFVDKDGNGDYVLVPLDWDDPFNQIGSGLE